MNRDPVREPKLIAAGANSFTTNADSTILEVSVDETRAQQRVKSAAFRLLSAHGHGDPGRISRLDNRYPANRPFLSALPFHFPHSQRPVSEPAPSFKRIE